MAQNNVQSTVDGYTRFERRVFAHYDNRLPASITGLGMLELYRLLEEIALQEDRPHFDRLRAD